MLPYGAGDSSWLTGAATTTTSNKTRCLGHERHWVTPLARGARMWTTQATMCAAHAHKGAAASLGSFVVNGGHGCAASTIGHVFFLCLAAYFEKSIMGATEQGPIFQGPYIQAVLLFFHVHVNIGFETMWNFLRHRVAFDEQLGRLSGSSKNESLEDEEAGEEERLRSARPVPYFSILLLNSRLLNQRNKDFKRFGKRVGLGAVVLAGASNKALARLPSSRARTVHAAIRQQPCST
eukprot:COSAG01_NODE_17660_length_1133_cov_1.370406_1_plen_235_part_01